MNTKCTQIHNSFLTVENDSKDPSAWSERRPITPRAGDWTWDLTTQEMYWSEAMFQLLGMEPDATQASYERLIEGVHPEDRARFESWLQAVLLGEAQSMLQHRVNTHATVSVCQQAVVLLDEGGTPWRVVGTVQGAGRRGGRTDGANGRKGTELEQRLLSITHDIKSPTQSLLMSAHVLADAWADASHILAEDHREYGEFLLGGLPYTEMREVIPSLIDDIRRDAELIHRFVNDLGRDATANGERFHTNDAVTQALRVLRYRTATLNGALKLRLGRQIPFLSGDLKKVERIVINLLNNSLDALQDPGASLEITTRVQNEGRCVELAVRDEGHGIPSHISAHVFEPFFTTKEDTGGAGLGLCITQSLVHELHGTLSLHSHPQGGALAVVRFPLSSRKGSAYSKDVH